jgi:hypothetical protein
LSPSILQKYLPLRKSAVAPPRDDDKPSLVKVGSSKLAMALAMGLSNIPFAIYGAVIE